MVFIPSGKFFMGADRGAADRGATDEVPQRTVYLDAFFMDIHEVTNAEYRKCEEAGACHPPRMNSSSTRESYYGNPEFGTYPVIGITWHDAEVYCRWAGKRLPTEAEWEKAARGTDGRTYPWGNFFDDDRVNCCDSAGDTIAVGTLPGGSGSYRVHNTAGNVQEWVADWWGATYYRTGSDRNPTGPPSGHYKVIRGASFRSPWRAVAITTRSDHTPESSHLFVGFRCARSASPP
jgi:formylglycine-generating enzyme required for sulfatase activity